MYERHTRYNFVEDEGIVRPRYLGEMSTQEPDENGDLHTHDFGQLISAVSGSMYVGTLDRVLLLSAAMAVWIPPDTKHWLRYSSNNVMVYVDVSRDEANHLGRDCKVVAMNPLLRALFAATMPEVSEVRETSHNVALHVLLAPAMSFLLRDVPLSLTLVAFVAKRRPRAWACRSCVK